MLSHLHRIASHQIIIISSLPQFHCPRLHVFISNVKLTVIFFGQREIIHGYTQTVIFALQVTLDGVGDCQVLKHVTIKNLVMDSIVIDSKLEVTAFCATVERAKLNTNSMTWRFCTMPIAISLLL